MTTVQDASAAIPQDTSRYRGGLARTLVRTLLVFTFIPLALMGGAAYLRSRTLLQEQVAGQLRAQIVDQLGDVDLAIKTKRIRLDRLVRAPGVLALAEQALRGTQAGNDALRADLSKLVNSLGGEGARATLTTYFIMDPAGRIALGSKPEWDGLQIDDPLVLDTLLQNDHVSYAFYDLSPLYDDQMVLLSISQIRRTAGQQTATLVGITESGELQDILQNLEYPFLLL